MISYLKFRIVSCDDKPRYNVVAILSARISIFKILHEDLYNHCWPVREKEVPQLSPAERQAIMNGDTLVYWKQHASKHWVSL